MIKRIGALLLILSFMCSACVYDASALTVDNAQSQDVTDAPQSLQSDIALQSADDEWSYEQIEYGGETGMLLTEYKGAEIDVFIPLEIEADGVSYPVLKLGDGLFKNNTNINSVTLSANVKAIGAEAFSGAENMVCVVANEGLSEIGDRAFSGCSKFNSIVLYDAVTSIGADAFEGCGSVKVYCNENSAACEYMKQNKINYVLMSTDAKPEVVDIDDISYYITNGSVILMSGANASGDVVIPAEIRGYPVTRVNAKAFSQNTAIRSVYLPDTVTDLGDQIFSNCTSLESVRLPQGISKIPSGAFDSCWALQGIDLPDGISRIGRTAFFACGNIKEITIPKNVSAMEYASFYGCSGLRKIDIPSGVRVIETYAFDSCANLESVTIGENVTTIQYKAFSFCSSLTSINIPSSVTNIEASVFNSCEKLSYVYLPQGLTNIDPSAFSNCAGTLLLIVYEDSYSHRYAVENSIPFMFNTENIDDVIVESYPVKYYLHDGKASLMYCDREACGDIIVPDKINDIPVTEIGVNAFRDCYNVALTLPDTITKINNGAFYGCGLTSVNIPDGVEYIGEDAFNRAGGLENVVLPSSLKEIGKSAFYKSTLKDASIPDGTEKIGTGAFSRSSIRHLSLPSTLNEFPDNLCWGCNYLKSAEIKHGTQIIGRSAFLECPSLKEITIPDTVQTIRDYAFCGCTALQSIILPVGVQIIEADAFSGCSSLETLKIPESVVSVGSEIVSRCKNLIALYVPASLTDITDNAFLGGNFIMFVHRDSEGYQYAVDHDIKYWFIDESEPEIQNSDGLVYLVNENEAILMTCDAEKAGTVIIPETVDNKPVVEIYQSAFANCGLIQSVSIPSTVKKIGSHAFEFCSQLETIDLSDLDIDTLELNTFSWCEKLTNISLPRNLKVIKGYVFSGCSALKEINIPDTVTSIGESTFYQCAALDNIELPDGLEELGCDAFYDCKALRSIKIPAGINTIPLYLCYGCESLVDVEIHENVKTIENRAFSGCTSLRKIRLPEKLEILGPLVFENCTSLESVNIPATIEYLDANLFENCVSLKLLFVPENVKPAQHLWDFEESIFLNCRDLIVCVVENSQMHQYVKQFNVPYFVIPHTENPFVSQGAPVSGVITSLSGAAVEGAAVELIDKNGAVRETVTTDENGSYSCTYAEVGSYTVRATDQSGNTGSNSFYVKRLDAFDVYVTDGTDVTIKDGAAVRGTVSNEGGAPIEGAKAELIDENGMVAASAETDPSGGYIFPYVPGGTYIIRVTDESGNAASCEITVFPSNGDVARDLTIRQGAALSGRVIYEDNMPAYWAEVIITNDAGDRIAALNTDAEGRYSISGIPVGYYNITAVYDYGNIKYTGATAVTISEPSDITAGDIVLKASAQNLGNATIEGKVTGHGQTQDSTVVLKDAFMNEIAVCTTGKNGKYAFYNVPDGAYTIIATTSSLGAGYTVITVENGKVTAGDTDITVYKSGTVEDLETLIDLLPDPTDTAAVSASRDDISKAKNIYDSLSDKNKRRADKEKIEKLNSLIAAISNLYIGISGAPQYAPTAEGLETLISDTEMLSQNSGSISLDVSVFNEVYSEEDPLTEKYDMEQIHKTAADAGVTIAEYFDISLTKSTESGEKKITDISKDSVGTGEVKITLMLSEQLKGHENYYMLHTHNGRAELLADIDNDPDTVTFETGKFSKFAMVYDDIERAGEGTDEPDPTAEPTTEPTAEPTTEPTAEPTTEPTAEPTTAPTASPELGYDYDMISAEYDDSGKLNIILKYTGESANPKAKLIAAVYNENDIMISADMYDIEGTEIKDLDFVKPDYGSVKLFIWSDTDTAKPLSEPKRLN